jgi:hypothetical protein
MFSFITSPLLRGLGFEISKYLINYYLGDRYKAFISLFYNSY